MDINNTADLQSFEISLRTGWKDDEKLMLWDEVRKAQKMGAPLKRVFENVMYINTKYILYSGAN